MWSIILIAFVAHCVSGQLPDDLPLVNVTQGTIQGSLGGNPERNIFEFYGIPYADSTSGSHRFKAPLPAPAFTDTFVANRKNVKCIRPLGVGYEGTEDCLVLDIFTPSLNETDQLPVMVWVKGKEFDPAVDPELSFRNFVDKDVVVVSINFRESILGFLCLGTETAPGNAGLKDIIAGLQWVQSNIAQFGGNPKSITLFGHGSGAAAVDLVTLSPMVSGLVQRAIIQSGNSIAPWSVTRNPTKYAIVIAEALGHTISDIESLSEVFTKTSVAALMAVINELDLTDNSLAFAPCIEKENLTGVVRFMDKSPYSTIVDGDYLQIPVMIGFVENEGTIRAEEAVEADWLDKMDSSFTDFIQPDLGFESEADMQSTVEDIRTFYFGDRSIDMENVADYISYHGDTMILVSAMREAKLRAATSSAPVYLYEFSYQGVIGETFIGPLIVSLVGPAHGEELAYLFDSGIRTTPPNDLDSYVRNILLERWTQFAKTGEPTSEYSSIEWLPITPESVNVLLIRNNKNTETNSNVELPIVNPHQETITFWEQIYSEHFLDAEGKWDLDDREDENDVVITTEEPSSSTTTTSSTTESPETEAPDETTTGSASTAVGYTFLIISLFTLLDKFHLSQILA